MSEPVDETTGYTPETVEEEKAAGLFCFINPENMCGPACVAFRTFVPEGPTGSLTEQQKHCSILTMAEQTSRHIVIIASLLSKSESKRRTEAADALREAALQPKSPFPYKKTT